MGFAFVQKKNQALVGYISTSSPVKMHGSKIDLLAATCIDGERYDLCSNEWKREECVVPHY